MLIPFHGPLPIEGQPQLEFTCTEISGEVMAVAISDILDPTDYETVKDEDSLRVGTNYVEFPQLKGCGTVAIGLLCGGSGRIGISNIKATVKRYISRSLMPLADPNESFSLALMDGNDDSGHKLKFAKIDYRNIYSG
jgi:hypothetical protein